MTTHVLASSQNQDYVLDSYFQNIFAAKTPEQYEELKKLIQNEGLREPLVVWTLYRCTSESQDFGQWIGDVCEKYQNV